jgi:regulator of cell morphogenesis and NO signaling
MVSRDDTVRDIVVRDFRTAMIFYRHGISFCCHGAQPLWEACRDSRVRVQDLLEDLERACADPDSVTPRFHEWEPETLIAYIVAAHHAYLRAALPAVAAHTLALSSEHGRERPVLRDIAAIAERLMVDLTSHMAKEESILFPFIVATADAARRGNPLPPAPFESIDPLLYMLEAEHETTGSLLDRLRALTDDFAPPAGCCTTERVCVLELDGLQRDLRTHVHLEQNLLFPRARLLVQGSGWPGHRRQASRSPRPACDPPCAAAE